MKTQQTPPQKTPWPGRCLAPCLALFLSLPLSGLSAALTPSATGDVPVATAIDGRTNHALASTGSSAFSSSDLTPEYNAPLVNNGIIDNVSANAWIAATAGNDEFVGVALASPISLGAVVWHGQTGYNGRSAGTWSLQYTTDATVDGSSSWTEIGTYDYAEPGCASPMPRSIFSFSAIDGVTGVRVVTVASACGAPMAVQELETYEPITTPPAILVEPIGGTAVAGGNFTFTVEASAAETIQWQKNGEDIPGATGSSYTIQDVKLSDAGDYSAVASNGVGTASSQTATLLVDPAPTYNSYFEAVLSANPIHYYPLDDTDGTTANDLGSLATTGGVYMGGYTLGRPAVTDRLGTSVQFDGAPGTLVDLGLFHPGDTITVEAWAKLDTVTVNNPSYHAIVARWDGSYELDFAPGDLANFVVRNDAGALGLAAGASASARAQWHHLVGIFSGGEATIYVDGVQGTAPAVGGVLQDAGPAPDRVMIGATRTGTEGSFNFKGCIDEVAIYDYALPPELIRAHFRAAFPPETPELTIERAALVSWPAFPPGFILQCAVDVEGPYTNVTTAPVTVDGINTLVVPASEGQKYYRLIMEE